MAQNPVLLEATHLYEEGRFTSLRECLESLQEASLAEKDLPEYYLLKAYSLLLTPTERGKVRILLGKALASSTDDRMKFAILLHETQLALDAGELELAKKPLTEATKLHEHLSRREKGGEFTALTLLLLDTSGILHALVNGQSAFAVRKKARSLAKDFPKETVVFHLGIGPEHLKATDALFSYSLGFPGILLEKAEAIDSSKLLPYRSAVLHHACATAAMGEDNLEKALEHLSLLQAALPELIVPES